ncbi:MAG: hypothetical protein ACJAUP_003370, partial [Cellvibrionaceae bacterium]
VIVIVGFDLLILTATKPVLGLLHDLGSLLNFRDQYNIWL